ncbi:MAG: hypothetical protein KME28_20435 [Pelatocladus maniniholoensis HA4357-MV3]|jgi:peptidoglycan hydrolase CwlO-like protein|uniref:Uncharacterized protein n=1 Tax=Pelatocladus maniniholoensis HA4357-MV3 TaxID=1117104 RepID=A0A9E3HB24_9NOST|nr:hypothetical protein [Pelatocladus maniniholoensis HA4357-MV3]
MARIERIRNKIQLAKENIQEFEFHFNLVVQQVAALHDELTILENQIDETNNVLRQWTTTD